MKQDALNLQDVPDEPTTLEADLVEDSNRVYHRDIAKYQSEQQDRYNTVLQSTRDWAEDELKKGTNGQQIDFMVTEHLVKTRKLLHMETARFIEMMKNREAARNRAIQVFLSTRHLPRV